MDDQLSIPQQQVYDALVDLYCQLGYAPSIRELVVRCGMSLGSVHKHLATLMQHGLIVRDVERGPRSIRIIGIDIAADIVRDLAKSDPVVPSPTGSSVLCAVCKRSTSMTDSTTWSEHDEDCPWHRARKLTGVD